MQPLKRRQLLLAALACAVSPAQARRAAPAGYLGRPEVRDFADRLAADHGLGRDWIERVLATGRRSREAERLMTPALTPPPRDWSRYRARAIDELRLREALRYGRTHQRSLARAEDEFGVPGDIVVAIIGIETVFGRVMGAFRTLDVLLTLAFDYPRRADFYRGELAHFLVLGHEGRIDVLKQTGSFAGAIGLPQFMPSSIRRYAVDFDGDGRVDLARSAPDAIGSVASFLARHGWEREAPVMFGAIANEAIVALAGGGITASRPWSELADLGVQIDGELPPGTPVVLLDLPYPIDDGDTAFEYRVGTVNLAAILHYNRSYFYGAAVAEFAAELRRRAQDAGSQADQAIG
jgi:membrane-bound lytic murein transglycosylase B